MSDLRLSYRTGNALDLDEVVDLYRRSTLAERRPVDRPDVMQAMIEHADLVVTAWNGDRLVGIARTLTDFEYAAYLADLAVDAAWQRRGIGRQLVERTRASLGPDCFVTLLAAPGADSYYGRLGFERHPRAWVLRP